MEFPEAYIVLSSNGLFDSVEVSLEQKERSRLLKINIKQGNDLVQINLGQALALSDVLQQINKGVEENGYANARPD